jgi:hypothetical protein
MKNKKSLSVNLFLRLLQTRKKGAFNVVFQIYAHVK